MARWRPSTTQLRAIYSIGADGLGIFVYRDTLNSLSRREVVVHSGPGAWSLTEGGEQLALDYATCVCKDYRQCDECKTVSDIRATRDLDSAFARMEARSGSAI